MNILGWAPERRKDVSSTPPANQIITLDLYHPQLMDPVLAESHSSTPVSPSMSSSTTPSESSRPQTPPRKGDPDWVARPRNCFFIFRCEYIKEHSRGGKDAPLLGTNDQGLSKRAGQAWRRLSPAEKAKYERLADAERIQHARDHPDYRFRPTRNDSNRRTDKPYARRTRTRASVSTSSSSSRRPKGQVLERAQTESAFATSHLLQSRPNSPFGSPLRSPSIHPEEPMASRPRSLSVPPLFTFPHYPHPHSGGTPHELRRVVSNQETNLPMAGPTSHMSFAASQELIYPGEGSTPRDHGSRSISGHQSPYQQPCHSAFAYNVSPFAAVSSSLANWNGASFHSTPYGLPLSMPLLSQSWSADPFFSEASSPDESSSQIHSPSYANPPAINLEPGIEYIPDENPAITHEFPHFGSAEHSVHDISMREYSPNNSARANALETPGIGLAERGTSEINGGFLNFDLSISDEQRLFDGLVAL
ncbi:hypothetical protein E1B28_003160 [Marasmius oreades]|uniref:HMG box domain-containing protein n=1 Tax=Marasmius oreades TaxID=181124 RepID=A0A9P7UKD8_9AGAR|nr:uncharacterized protein E1B28_003160 [Marasmius oreades]KAG7085610.1 hypothetical protein E1B28_003160 [Marasmius oreades]